MTTLAGQRDVAILCFGIAAGRRREELARVSVEHLTLVSEGLELFLPWSKTDQEGDGATIPVSYGAAPNTCPVRTLRRWLTSAGIDSGPIFRCVDRHDRVHGPMSPRAIAEVVKRCATRVGLDAKDFAGHSLRSGFATSAARAGKSMASIAAVTQHKDLRTLGEYVQRATLFDDAANKDFGF